MQQERGPGWREMHVAIDLQGLRATNHGPDHEFGMRMGREVALRIDDRYQLYPGQSGWPGETNR
jgi:hypothetical protein